MYAHSDGKPYIDHYHKQQHQLSFLPPQQTLFQPKVSTYLFNIKFYQNIYNDKDHIEMVAAWYSSLKHLTLNHSSNKIGIS